MPFDDEDPPFIEPDPELDELARNVIGAAIRVHRELGPGLDEGIYESALCMELKHCSISFDRQVIMPVRYRGEIIGEKRFDLIVGGRLIVELKAVSELLELHRAQLITYLKIAQLKLGLLINFNSYPLKDGIKRVICP